MRENLAAAPQRLMAGLRIAAAAMLVASVGINFANIIGRYFSRCRCPGPRRRCCS